MSSPDNLLHQYNKILSGISTDVIKGAEKVLASYQQHPSFLSDNLILLTQAKVPSQTKKVVAVYLTNYSKRIVKKRYLPKSEEVVRHFINMLNHNLISIQIKVFIVRAIQAILTAQSHSKLKQIFNKQFVDFIQIEFLKDDSTVNFSYVVFYAQALMKNGLYTEEMKELIKSSFTFIIGLTLRLQKMAPTLSPQAPDVKLLIIKLISQYTYVIKHCMRKMGLLDIQATRLLFLPQLQQVLTSGFELTANGNTLNSYIFFAVQDKQTNRAINKIKSNYLQILSSFIRLIISYVKHPQLLKQNPLYNKIPQFLEAFLGETQRLMSKGAISSFSNNVLSTLDQLFNLYVTTMRINDFYHVFSNHKNQLIDLIILPTLALSPKDIDDFYQDSLEFVNHTLQIASKQTKTQLMHKQYKDMMSQQDDEIQFENVKTYSAELLSTLCKYQDGCLSYIVQQALSVLNNQINGPSKSLMLLIICILDSHLQKRNDLKMKVATKIIDLLQSTPLPVIQQTQRKQTDIQYSFILLAFSKMIQLIREVFPNIISETYQLGAKVFQSPTLNHAHKYFICNLFDQIAQIQQCEEYAVKILIIYNHLLQTCEEVPLYLLDSYFTLLKYNPEVFCQTKGPIIDCIKLLCTYMQKQVQKPVPAQIYLNKCFNIIREIGQSQYYIPKMIEPIEEAILPLVKYINGVTNLDYEEDILLLITSFVQRGKKVTQNQQKMFEIIPKIFYNQYQGRFAHAFHTIQLFIYYGSNIIIDAPAAMNSIVDMSITSLSSLEYKKRRLSQSQNVEGVLILQSLVLKCGAALTQQLLNKIIAAVLLRLDKVIQFSLLSSNLYALLSLLLVHTIRFFSEQENEIILIKVLSNLGTFSGIEYSPKVVTAGLTQLLLYYQNSFISKRYVQILDLIVTLLQIASVKKKDNSMFGVQQKEQEKQYANLLVMLTNDMKNLDEFSYFKKQIEKIKGMNLQMLQQTVASFPKAKRDFFINILRVERVQNEPRQIYKIKRP